MDSIPGTLARPRALSTGGKILLAVLVVYAFAVILPDTLRPTFLHRLFCQLLSREDASSGRCSASWGWYPLATLGFKADNDGTVTWVDPDGPAGTAHLQVGDRIDLRKTNKTDRRAVNELVFVAHDRPITIHIAMKRNAFVPADVPLKPSSEDLRFFPDATLLVFDQLAGVFFIGLCTFLVLRHPTREIWGLFLFGIWYNAGQYFVWYANLPADALGWFDYLQAFFQAAGLTGLLMFALHFPQDFVTGWRQRAERWLVLPFLVLLVTNVWVFRNFTSGDQTEGAYELFYYLTFAVFAIGGALSVHTLITQPSARPRIRWVIVGALWGLLCFLFADVYEATRMLDWLPFEVPEWVLNMLYAQSVWFPVAIWYAVRRHRVINVRLVVSRAIGLTIWSIVALLLVEAGLIPLHRIPLLGIVVGVIGIVTLHEVLHLREFVSFLFYRAWYRAERDLKGAADLLMEGPCSIEDLHRFLIGLPVERLALTSAALFQRQPDGSYQRVHASGDWPDSLMPALPSGHHLLSSLHSTPLRLPDDYWDAIRPFPCPMPVLAIPIRARGVVSRIVLFGPHTNEETLDRDEVNLIGRLAKAAEAACAGLDAEALRAEYERKLQKA